MPPADKYPNEKIGGAESEAKKVTALEDQLRTKLSAGGASAADARLALQHEVDLINYVIYERKDVNGKTLSERDPNYVSKLVGQIERNDGYAENTASKQFHMPTVQLVNGKLEILPDKQIKAEERLAGTNYKYGHLPASVDVVDGANILRDSRWPQNRITPYEKEVFGTNSDSKALQLAKEATSLHTAITKVRTDIINRKDATKSEHELSAIVEDLNKRGSAHVNQLAMGLSRYDFKLLDIKDGTIVVKSDEQMKTVLKPYM